MTAPDSSAETICRPLTGAATPGTAERRVRGYTVESIAVGPHPCPLPGWWRRLREHIGTGSVVRCDACGQRWQLDGGSYASGPEWERIQ